jgi:hypothetical protein
MSIDICYLVSHGFGARMVTQTDLLGRLQDSGHDVALMAPDDTDPNLVEYCERRHILLHRFPDTEKNWASEYLFCRKYYLEDIRGNTALWEKHVHALRYNKARHPWRRLRPYHYGMINRMIPRFPGIRRRFEAKEALFLNSPKVDQWLSQFQPRLVVSTYPVNVNEAMMLNGANRAQDVKTCIQLLSWDNITCKGRFPESADSYIAWGPVMRDELKEHYDATDSMIGVCGVPHFDLHATVRETSGHLPLLRAMGLNEDLPYLFFGMSSPRFAPKEIDIVEWLAKKIQDHAFGELQLVVRPHPQNVMGSMADQSWLPRLDKLDQLPNVAIDYPKTVKSGMDWSMKQSDMEYLSHLLGGAKITLNSGSTLCIDALMHDKPVVLTSFDAGEILDYWTSARRLIDFPHLKKLVDAGGINVCQDFDELEEAIQNEALLAPVTERQATRDLQCASSDGGATTSVIDRLHELLS